MSKYQGLIESIAGGSLPSRERLAVLLSDFTDGDRLYAASLASQVSRERFGDQVYIRGLIEFSNYCKNNCYYCGIRRDNRDLDRYRLTKEEILACCQEGYKLGFRTFVLQSGEDPYYTDEKIVELIHEIKSRWSDCALTLSIGEKERDVYQAYFDAGADRYLLRHETACQSLYAQLHPAEMSWEHRMDCLRDLREIGFQTGCGWMVGTPGQTPEMLADDLIFAAHFRPQMVGIGPFLPHHSTPFRDEKPGSFEQTLFMLSLTRLLLPDVLLPATTALGTIHPSGRELGLQAGANVVMPNLSPVRFRKQYELYDNKICTGEESAQCRTCLSRRVENAGYRLVVSRGDYRPST